MFTDKLAVCFLSPSPLFPQRFLYTDRDARMGSARRTRMGAYNMVIGFKLWIDACMNRGKPEDSAVSAIATRRPPPSCATIERCKWNPAPRAFLPPP